MRGLVLVVLAAAAAVPCVAQDADAPELHGIAFDPSFGTHGPPRNLALVRRHFGALQHVAIDSAGRIVAGGTKRVRPIGRSRWQPSQPRVARFLPDGRLDTAFGDRGVAFVPLYGSMESLAVDAHDRVVFTGELRDRDEIPHAAVRLRADGTLDPAFSGDGMLPFSRVFGVRWGALRIAADGESILVVARRDRSNLGPVHLIRITADGSTDFTYGTGGLSPEWAAIPGFALDPRGGAVVLATPLNQVGGANPRSAVVRFDPDGASDAAFGHDGVAAFGAQRELRATSMDVDSLGRILAFDSADGPNPGLYRFLADGTLDDAFARDGRADWAGRVPGAELTDPRPLLATARDAPDRSVIAGEYLTIDAGTGRSDGPGVYVESFDSAQPRNLGLLVSRGREAGPRHVSAIAMSPDGTSAVLVGAGYDTRGRFTPAIDRVDLTARDPYPLPDIVPTFVGAVQIEELPLGHRFRAEVAFRNWGTGDWPGGAVDFYLSDDATLDLSDLQVFSSHTPALPPGRTRRRVVLSGLIDLHERPVSGAFLLAVVPGVKSHETSISNNLAIAAPLR